MEVFICPECAKCFTRNYSLKRHLNSKHNIQDNDTNTHNIQHNIHQNKQKEHQTKQNIHPNEQNVYHTFQSVNQPNIEDNVANKCIKCYKILSDKSSLTRHLKTCKGFINKLECEYCKCTFKHKKSRFKHYKTCKEKNKTPEVTINNTTNNINSHNNTTNNNTTNNNTVNLTIVYKIGDDTIDLNTQHFTESILKKIISCRNNTASLEEFVKQAFANPENRFIKKQSLREPHSELHIGNNKWEYVLDKQVYPDLATVFANNMLEYIYTKRHALKRSAFEKLRDTLDYLADKGYINTDDKELQKKIENEFKVFVKNLKLIVHNVHKNA